MKKMTIIDIAKLAEVGKSTVSRVLNGDEGVKAETREKVLEVIREVGFVPSKSARSMRLKKEKVIGIINTRLDSKSENQAIRGMLDVFYKKSYEVLFLESLFSIEKTKEHVNLLKDRNISGIIIFGIASEDYSFLDEIKVPILMIAQDIEKYSSVTYDGYRAIGDVLKYLKKLEKKNIAFIGVDKKDLTTGLNRYLAYEDFCKKNNKKNISKFGDFSYESGYDLAKEILEENFDCDAIVCATDNISLGVKKYLNEIDRQDIIVTGIGGDKLLSFLYENFISIDFEYKKSGKKAANKLIKLINGEPKISKVQIKGKIKI